MYIKFLVLIFITALSMNLYSNNKKMIVVVESNFGRNLNEVGLKVLAKKAFKELIKSKFIKKLKKKKKGNSIALKLGKIQNKTDSYNCVSMIKSFLSMEILKNDEFLLLSEEHQDNILEKERKKELKRGEKNSINETENEIKPDFIIIGSITSKKGIFIFDYKLINSKTRKEVFEKNVTLEKK